MAKLLLGGLPLLCSCTNEYAGNSINYWAGTLGMTDRVSVSREAWVLHPTAQLCVSAIGNAATQTSMQKTVGQELVEALEYEFTSVTRVGAVATLNGAVQMARANRCEVLLVPSFLRSVATVNNETDDRDKPEQLRIHLVNVGNARSLEAAMVNADDGWFTNGSGEAWRKEVLGSYAHSLARAAKPQQ